MVTTWQYTSIETLPNESKLEMKRVQGILILNNLKSNFSKGYRIYMDVMTGEIFFINLNCYFPCQFLVSFLSSAREVYRGGGGEIIILVRYKFYVIGVHDNLV